MDSKEVWIKDLEGHFCELFTKGQSEVLAAVTMIADDMFVNLREQLKDLEARVIALEETHG